MTSRKSQGRTGGASPKSAMAKVAIKEPAQKTPAHQFVVSRQRDGHFQAGLRPFAQYRDLGVRDATDGAAVAQIIRFVGPFDAKTAGKKHYHFTEFQLMYLLQGRLKLNFEKHGDFTMTPGDAWLQPNGIKHTVLDFSDDCEILEVTFPANFKTVQLDKDD